MVWFGHVLSLCGLLLLLLLLSLARLATSAWVAGLTPGSVIRGLGPWGPGLIDRYVNGRFSAHGEENP